MVVKLSHYKLTAAIDRIVSFKPHGAGGVYRVGSNDTGR